MSKVTHKIFTNKQKFVIIYLSKNKIITTALKVIALAENNIQIPFYDILKMRNTLLDEMKK